MQDDRVATCICTDGSSFQGIIVGADGAYSSVRLSLYRQLKDKGLLPAPDQRPLQYQYRALVGMTRPLDPNLFRMVTSNHSDTRLLISRGDRPFTLWCVPVAGNRLCWMLDEPLKKPVVCPDVEDWSLMPQTIHEMCQSYREMQGPLEGTLVGELFDLTPPGTMASLSREEAFFSTWTFGKVVLMGDGMSENIAQ
ncbi:hypothetical protein B0O80DRAFT_245381 [Mortierella sp. GBAus27b]|nr:hypothetical protein B0O80DRAFT_245381 [Mortierella sp. GBAus27b]